MVADYREQTPPLAGTALHGIVVGVANRQQDGSGAA